MKRKVILCSLTKFVQSWTLNSCLNVPFGLEISDRSKPTKSLSSRRGANKIIYFVFRGHGNESCILIGC